MDLEILIGITENYILSITDFVGIEFENTKLLDPIDKTDWLISSEVTSRLITSAIDPKSYLDHEIEKGSIVVLDNVTYTNLVNNDYFIDNQSVFWLKPKTVSKIEKVLGGSVFELSKQMCGNLYISTKSNTPLCKVIPKAYFQDCAYVETSVSFETLKDRIKTLRDCVVLKQTRNNHGCTKQG